MMKTFAQTFYSSHQTYLTSFSTLMTTIREVAQKAGVSFTTVSHVINNTRFVSEETRERVLAAMEELNYRPNALAQSLRSGKTHTIGLILPDISNPFFAEVGRSIEEAAFRQGYSVILCNTESDPHKEQVYVDLLSKKQVDGVIFVAAGDQADSLHILLSQQLPVVVVDRDLPDVQLDAVLTDNCQGGNLAAKHLIEMGHTRIACITGRSKITPSADRLRGFRDALHESGLEIDESLIKRGDYHPESGRSCTAELLLMDDRPTAIFVCNDIMALGALHAAAQAGLRIPQDLSIVGFDDIELAAFTIPPLTTIAQPKIEIGECAARLLLERIASPQLPFRREIFPTQLVHRKTTGHPSSNGHRPA